MSEANIKKCIFTFPTSHFLPTIITVLPRTLLSFSHPSNCRPFDGLSHNYWNAPLCISSHTQACCGPPFLLFCVERSRFSSTWTLESLRESQSCWSVRATPHAHHNPNMTITETSTMLHKEHEGLSVGVAETILTQKNQEQIIKTCM